MDWKNKEYIDKCNKAVSCTIYPSCNCPAYDYKRILCRKFPLCVDQKCIYAHEELAHKYRTKLCKYGKKCLQKYYCPFAHSENHLRTNSSFPIKGYTWIPKYRVFQRNSPLNSDLRLLDYKIEDIKLDLLYSIFCEFAKISLYKDVKRD